MKTNGALRTLSNLQRTERKKKKKKLIRRG